MARPRVSSWLKKIKQKSAVITEFEVNSQSSEEEVKIPLPPLPSLPPLLPLTPLLPQQKEEKILPPLPLQKEEEKPLPPLPPQQEEKKAPRIRRVSISELPRLKRASTIEIEFYYFKLHARVYAKKAKKITCKVLKRGAQLIIFFPFWPVSLFAIGLDKIDEALRKKYGVRTASEDVYYFTHDGEEFWVEF